jgi:sortase A
LAGVALLLYPWISNYLFENRTDGIVEAYQEETENTNEDDKEQMRAVAKQYNQLIYEVPVRLSDPFSMEQAEEKTGVDYDSILKVDDEGLMATIEIPKISVNLPIYHGTDSQTLEKGIGHLQGTSFPVGGENTHCVLTGHTGLNYAKMFTDLTELEEGDCFFITVLGEKMAYKVCEIQVILPDNTDPLYITEGKDLVTLITCTPYGVNDHRLLVTGERTEYNEEIYQEETNKETANTQWMRSYTKAILMGLVAVPFILAFLVIVTKKIRKYKSTNPK